MPSVLGMRVSKAVILWERSIALPTPDGFSSTIRGQNVHDVGRRGKFLRFDLDRDVLLIHLRMSGDVYMETQGSPYAPHHRVVINLEGDQFRLAFNDARKFGRLWLTSRPEEVLGKLGPEPLQDDFSTEILFEKLGRWKRQLKPLLMDQTFVAGLGNIYTDEALHLSRLHPCMPSNRLSREAAGILHDAICSVLQEGIQRNGASIDWVYRGGQYQHHFRVYQRAGQPCLTCGMAIQRILVGQRSSYFCPNCQRL